VTTDPQYARSSLFARVDAAQEDVLQGMTGKFTCMWVQ
jgi:hypothetical protein